ncbi:MAG: DUF2207 domain-containing protein [Actinomycetales bacterium]|nr:DUF2207 domain-containing protein [Actinomycetales bacterium]
MRRPMRPGAGRLLATAALVAAGLALVAGPAAASPGPDERSGRAELPAGAGLRADVNDFAIADFHADYRLGRDASGHATLSVVETFTALYPEFDQNKGLYRDIPEYYGDVRLFTSVESVVDENGDPVPYFTEYYGDFFSVGLGDDSYVHGPTTYVISYTQRDVVGTFADTGIQEFYWDVNGTDWAQPFGPTSARVEIAPELVPALGGSAACYAGTLGTKSPCESGIVRTDGAPGEPAVFEVAQSSLAPGESLTFAIGFAPDTFEPGEEVVPPSQSGSGGGDYVDPRTGWEGVAPAAILMTIVGIGIGFVSNLLKRERGPVPTPASDIIIAQYTRPENLTLLEDALVAGRKDRAFAAQVVDLSVRGAVRLLEHPEGRNVFEVELVDPSRLDEGLETEFAQALFGDKLEVGDTRVITDHDTELSKKFYPVLTKAEKHLESQGLRGTARTWWGSGLLVGVAVLAAFISLVLLVIEFAIDEPTASWFALGATIYGWGAAWGNRREVMTLSAAGRRVNDHLLGLRDYLTIAEKDRLRVLQSVEGAERIDVADAREMVKLYEKLLPFAVLWGVEDSWAEVLAVAAQQASVPLTWVSGTGSDPLWQLHSTLASIQRSTPAPPPPPVSRGFSGGGSSWSSSGGGSSFSSGSFGGGFSGGGGGGGGGRGR